MPGNQSEKPVNPATEVFMSTAKAQKLKGVLTTGQVSRICHVAPRTVCKWFDSGRLRGYRIPGGRDRRIPLTELMRFLKTHGIPTEILGPQ